MYFGFLNLNKPAGVTSHDCVARVRRILSTKQVGHGGTLDPTATGVLPIAVGKATRLLQFLPEEKGYRAKIRFGMTTTTDDLEGEILETKSATNLSLDDVQEVIGQFMGDIRQIPPAFSAIQQGGKRLYELARAGEKVEVPERTVYVKTIDVLSWCDGEFPEVEVDITCGGGTYIRAIARDIGNLLGVGGTLAALTRTLSCGMKLSESVTFEELEKQLDGAITSPAIALSHLEVIRLTGEQVQGWYQGQKIVLNDQGTESEKPVLVQTDKDLFLGIGELAKTTDVFILMPKIVIVTNQQSAQL
jgi:tRNA pseudouridine55 synthase